MDKKGANIFVSLLLIVIFIAAVAGGAAYDILTSKPEPKRAIIFCHALLAGSLYNADTGENLWDPFQIEDVNLLDFLEGGDMVASVIGLMNGDRTTFFNAINKIIEMSPDSIMGQLILDEDGNSRVNVQPCDYEDFSENRLRYGALNAYKDLAESLTSRYGEKADVVLFNYDWRIDNRISGARLEEFVNEKGYDEIVFMSHSMGGMVISNYLSRSQANRDKVSLYCAYAAPFYGSLMALSMLTNPNGIRYSFEGMLRDMGFDSFADMLVEVYDDQFLPMITNMTSIYQLLPTYELLTTSMYAEGESFLYIDDEPILTEEALYDYYYNADWAKGSDGTVKKAMREFREYIDSMYLTDKDGKRVHVASTVNTRYFVGTGCRTEKKVYIENGVFAGTDTEKSSDGTVLYSSGTLGLPLDCENVYEIKNCLHDTMACNFSYIDDETYAEIDKIWA